jgi:hypothetical protein
MSSFPDRALPRPGMLPRLGLLAALALPLPLLAQQKDTAAAGYTTSGNAEFVRMASAGAPANLSERATIARMDRDGSLITLRPGSNGFTCALLPDGSNTPFCGDTAGTQFLVDAFSKKPRPTNTKPGIVYMAQGGMHYEAADGQVVMEPMSTTKSVKEPPHWMLIWPVDSTSGLPTRPNAGGSYIMFAGTPYAHLMIYQDPKMLNRK